MDDREGENQIILSWAIRLGVANRYENLDRPLTKYEFLKIIYKLLNRYTGGEK